MPGAVPDMAEMAARGAVGFKAFMCDSGLPEFPRADDMTLLDGLKEAARLGLPVAVHAESEEMTSALRAARHRRDARDFLDVASARRRARRHPARAAVRGRDGRTLHIVHVSSGRGVALAAEARARGVDVSIETCPHYLCFTEEDLERLGTVAKCAPPLRTAADRDVAVERARARARRHRRLGPFADRAGREGGRLHVGAWGGIAGVQSTLPVLLDRGHHRQRPAARARSRRCWRRAGAAFPRGAEGRDRGRAATRTSCWSISAASFTLKAGDLQQRHKTSPYVGATFRGAVRRTLRRGETIFADGRVTARSTGRMVRPESGI